MKNFAPYLQRIALNNVILLKYATSCDKNNILAFTLQSMTLGTKVIKLSFIINSTKHAMSTAH